MKRTTISLPDRVADALAREARRRHVPVSLVAREALEASLGLKKQGKGRELPFFAIGRSGHRTTSEDVEEILRTEWGRASDR